MTSDGDSMSEKVCPACGHQNLPGADNCVNCQTDLFHLGSRAPLQTENALELSILKEMLSKLDLRDACLVDARTKVSKAIEMLVDDRRGALFVVDSEKDAHKVIGIFGAFEVMRSIYLKDPMPLDDQMAAHMSLHDEWLGQESRIVEALHEINIRRVEYLPVYKAGQPVKYLGIRNIIDYLIHKVPEWKKMQTEGEKK